MEPRPPGHIIDNIFIKKKKRKEHFFSEGVNVKKPGGVPENTGLNVKKFLVLRL